LHLGIPVKTEKNAVFTAEYEKCATCPATQSTMPATEVTDEATNRFEAVFPQSVLCVLVCLSYSYHIIKYYSYGIRIFKESLSFL